MIGWIILIIIVIAVLYFLTVNNKINMNSLTESSPSIGRTSDSVQTDPQTGQFTVKFNAPKIKSLRILHGENKISKVFVAERPLTLTEIISESNRSIGTNCVFIGTVNEIANSGAGGAAATAAPNATSSSVDIKQFKNTFIIFKNLEFNKIKENVNMVRYESEGMVYCLIDANSTIVPDLREVSYPITVYTTNPTVQLKLKEWDYAQVNDSGTLFIKNEKSFRVQ